MKKFNPSMPLPHIGHNGQRVIPLANLYIISNHMRKCMKNFNQSTHHMGKMHGKFQQISTSLIILAHLNGPLTSQTLTLGDNHY
jgi:hypothetical protein